MSQKHPRNIVYTRGERLPSGIFPTTARMTDDEPDGAFIEAPDPLWPILWETFDSDRGILRVEVAAIVAPDAPAVWFVQIDEPRSSPPATHLVAFATDARPAGTVVNHYQFATMGVKSEEQVAAVRWYPRDGLVHQVYVAPEWRRHQAGTLLLYSAGAVHQSMGWPGRLHSDGRRTSAGDALTSHILHPVRIAPLTETMPDMDPSDA
jgi:GNAT superfamily N-acetyltransferase